MDLSLIIPVYNEEENLQALFGQISDAIEPMGHDWEVVFIDDGSTDGSLSILRELARREPEHVRVIVFRRNFGQTAAIAAGLDNSRGEIIVLLDADLQNDPQDIPMMLETLDEGYDVVSGWRRLRKDNALTRTLPSVFANALISLVTGVHLHDYGCTLKAYRRSALEGFRLYGEMHRFIPVFASSIGARITEVAVRHHPRRFGKTKYGLDRTLKVILDLMTAKFLLSYSHKPMRLFGGAGLGLGFLGSVLLLYLGIRRYTGGVPVLGSPLFQIAIMLLIMGSQSILMGLMAELLARTYHESQKKLTYTVRETIPPGSVNDKVVH